MSENLTEMDQASQLTSAQQRVIDEVEEPVDRLRIHPRKVLELLSHLRIDSARIKPIEGRTPKAGGNADVEAAILVSVSPSSYSKPDDQDYVAVKKLRFDDDADDDRALAPLAHEVSLLNDLSHENVVKVIGFVEDVGQKVAWMVFAWEKNGNLREFIRSAKWELPERVSLMNDIARGLSYLHGRDPPICHGDLKSLNILVNSEHRAVITDFGSARAVGQAMEAASTSVDVPKTSSTAPHHAPTEAETAEALIAEVAPSGEFITMTGPAWTIRWAAPELLKGDSPGLASDTWALGWIFWEAVTGNFPFEKDTDVLAIVRITKGDFPTVENEDQFKQIQALCSLMRECWRLSPSERPTATKCLQLISWMDQTAPSRREENGFSVTRSSGLLFALGWIQLRDGMHNEAQDYFEQSLKVSESVGDDRGKARALTAFAEVFKLRSEYSKAEESCIQARDICSKLGDRMGFARSLKSLGDVYYVRSEYTKAEESYIEARDISLEAQDGQGFVQAVKSLGDVYRSRNEYSKAEESYVQARDLYSQIADRLGFAQSVKSLGDMYRVQNKYSKAEESYIQARDIYSQIGDRQGLAQSVWSLGDVYRMRDEYSKAEESYIQARDMYSQIGDQLGFARSVWSLGEVHRMRDEYSTAEELYIQAFDIYSQIGSRLGCAQSVSSLAEVYRMQKDYPKAEESFIRARDIYSEIGQQLGFAQSVGGLGDVYRMQEEYSKAEESYIEARDVYSKLGHSLGLAQSFEGMGRIHSARGEYAMAESSYVEALQIYLHIGDLYASANIAYYRGWLYRKQAQYSAAELLVRAASTIYGGLGFERSRGMCEIFIEEIRPFMDQSTV